MEEAGVNYVELVKRKVGYKGISRIGIIRRKASVHYSNSLYQLYWNSIVRTNYQICFES